MEDSINFVQPKGSQRELAKRQALFALIVIAVGGIALLALSISMLAAACLLVGIASGFTLMLAWLYKEIARDHVSDALQDHMLIGMFQAFIRRRT